MEWTWLLIFVVGASALINMALPDDWLNKIGEALDRWVRRKGW